MSIRYGFFNAIRNDNGQFDRVYSNEDMNKFLSGIVNQNGVFSNVGNGLKVDYPDGVTANSPFDNLIVPEGKEPDGVEPGSIVLRVLTGKAMVNAHWVAVESYENIYIPKPTIAGQGKYYMVTLRWDEIKRKCSFEVTEIPNEFSYNPIGYTNNGFNPVDGVCEICLATIHVPSANKVQNAYASAVEIISRIGENVCPYISHLVIGPSETDIDTKLAIYYNKFNDWFKKVQIDNDLDLSIKSTGITFNGFRKFINLSQIPDYSYDSLDKFFVFINGLYTEEYDIVDVNGVKYISFRNLQDGVAYTNNICTIKIIKASTLGLEDGDDIYY